MLFILLGCFSSKKESETSTAPQNEEDTNSFDQIHCSTKHVERSMGEKLMRANPNSAIYFTAKRDNDTWNIDLLYGDLYSKGEGVLNRSINSEGFSVEDKRITATLNLDSSTENSTEGPKLGSVSLQLKGEGGFYVGTAQYAELVSAVKVTCWTVGLESQYRYASGECLNEQGEQGVNPWTLEMVRETKNGECTDLSGEAINEGFTNYPTLSWNLKGANLNNSDMVFANMVDANLEGAKLSSLSIGYAQIAGSADEYTQAPDFCELSLRSERPSIKCSM